jgi:hypothetical protein
MSDSPLSRARKQVEAARGRFDTAKRAFHKAEDGLRLVQGTVADERYQRNLALSRGGPRPAPGFKAPPTPAEVAATAAQEKLDAAAMAHSRAAYELQGAEVVLLAAENKVLDRWRQVRALEIMKLQRDDADAELIEAKLAELRAMCPSENSVRIHQRFTLSALVRDVLYRPDELLLDVPGDQLRGEGAGYAYEVKRTEILAQAEAAHPEPLEPA